jgi:hypothetical protein
MFLCVSKVFLRACVDQAFAGASFGITVRS